MTTPATGAAMTVGLRREVDFGVPDPTATRVYYRPVLPFNADLVRALVASPEVNQYGFGERGVAGAITGAVDFAVLLQASTAPEIFEHVMGGRATLTKSTLEASIYQYVASPTRATGDTSYDAIVALSPVEVARLYGIKFSSLNIPIGSNNPIPVRMAGFASHGTRLSAFTHASGTGTYAVGPEFRGPLRRPRASEKVYLKVTQVAGALQYKAERVPSGGTATYPGAAITYTYDDQATPYGTWQPLTVAYQFTGTVTVGAGGTAVTGVGTRFLEEATVGDYVSIAGENKIITAITTNTAMTIAAHTAGAAAVVMHRLLDDAGIWDTNRDPFEVLFYGTSTTHADLAVNDVYTVDTTWTGPVATYPTGQRFTSAHWSLYWRRQGATVWRQFRIQTGTIGLGWPVAASYGDGSRYYQRLDRDGMFAPTLQFTRHYADTVFTELAESQEPFEIRAIAEGQRLGTGAYRESIDLIGTAGEVSSRTRPVGAAGAVIETVNLSFKAPETGGVPLTATIITDRNYTVAT